MLIWVQLLFHNSFPVYITLWVLLIKSVLSHICKYSTFPFPILYVLTFWICVCHDSAFCCRQFLDVPWNRHHLTVFPYQSRSQFQWNWLLFMWFSDIYKMQTAMIILGKNSGGVPHCFLHCHFETPHLVCWPLKLGISLPLFFMLLNH